MTQQSYKKFVASAATATLVASALVPVASANVTTSAFTDVPGSYTDAVEFIVSNNIAKGLTATQFGISNQIKRGDVAIMIANAANLNDEKAPAAGFSDVPKRGALAINSLKAAGVISGKTTTKFGFEDNVTRGEAALMLQKAFKLEAGTTKNNFSDVSDRYDAAVDALVANKVTSGINDKQFGTANNIKRGDFAKFLFALKDQIVVDGAVVSSVTVANPTTLTVKLKEAKQGLTAADFSVVVDGAVVVPTGVVADSASETYTLTIPTLDGKAGTVAVNKVEAAYNFAKAEVSSVKAINAEEILVTFTKEVSDSAAVKANYEISKNGTKVAGTTAIQDIKVDGKTALIRLVAGQQAVEGTKYVVQTTDAITTTTGEALPRYASPEYTYKNGTAPALQKTTLDAGTETLTLTFDRPVKAATTLVKVDGIDIVNKTLAPVNATKAGNYSYTIALNGSGVTAEQLKSFKAEGAHEVVIFDVADTAVTNPVVASVITGAYSVTKDTAAPAVVSVKALTANKFFIETNRAVDLTTATLKVEKGTHEFVKGAVATDYSKKDFATGTLDGKPGVYVVVTEENPAGSDLNPLYKGSETSANLKVTFENYKANDLVGAKYVGNVTLNKNATKPEVQSSQLDATGNKLTVTFKEKLASAPATADVVIRDKDGVVIPSTAVTPSLNGSDASIVEFAVSAGTLKNDKAPYTVEFKAGKVQYDEDKTSVASYIVKSQKNDKIVTTVRSSESGFKYKAFTDLSGATVTDSGNVITVDYNTEMTDSARQASNYMLDGKALPNGTSIDFVGTKNKVVITLPEGSVKTSTGYKLSISTDVTTKTGEHIVKDLQTKAAYEKVVNLVDNTKPELKSAVYVVAANDSTATSKIKVTFNESLDSALNTTDAAKNLKIVINGSEQTGFTVADAVAGDAELEITLGTPVAISQAATISVVADNAGDVKIKDNSTLKNPAKIGSSTIVNTKELDISAAMSLAQANSDIATDVAAATAVLNGVADSATGLTKGSATAGSTIVWTSNNVAILNNAGTGVAGVGGTAVYTATVNKTVNGQAGTQKTKAYDVVVNADGTLKSVTARP